jgi:hypothetical protein
MDRNLPKEPEAFTEAVARLIRVHHPHYAIELVGPREVLVNGRRLDLENLFRMVAQDPSRGEEIVDHYIEQLFAGDALQFANLSFDLARPRIMPRIQSTRIFQHLAREHVAHVPFVNDTVVVFVTDLPNMTVSITTEQVLRWGIDVAELERIARKNLDEYTDDLEVQIIESRDGGRAAIVGEHDGYDAARLLLSCLYSRLAPQLGGDFFVALPARDMFVALTPDPPAFVQRLQQRVEEDYRRLPYPITSDLFLVTRDGVAGTRPVTDDDDRW